MIFWHVRQFRFMAGMEEIEQNDRFGLIYNLMASFFQKRLETLPWRAEKLWERGIFEVTTYFCYSNEWIRIANNIHGG